MATAALVVAIVSALAAVGAVVYARRLDGTAKEAVAAARASAAASERSADAVERGVALDSGRRRGELTPRFSVSWVSDGRHLRMRFLLTGPPALERLDRLALQVREFEPLQFVALGMKVGWPPEDVFFDRVWAPYRFGGESQDEDGRRCVLDSLPVGDAARCVLEPVPSPPGMSADDWGRLCGSELQLLMDCQLVDWEPWSLLCAIDTTQDSGTVDVP